MNVHELKKKLIQEKYNTELYGIKEPVLMEGHCLDFKDGKWRTFYFERGVEFELELFDSEEDACERIYKKIKSDQFMKKNKWGE